MPKPAPHPVTFLSYYLRTHGVSQNQLAEACGLSKHRVSRLCTDKFSVRDSEKTIISEALGCSQDELFNPQANYYQGRDSARADLELLFKFLHDTEDGQYLWAKFHKAFSEYKARAL